MVTGPLRDKSRPIETICAGCELLPTKPGNIPAQLSALVMTAYRMEALAERHALAAYPDFFTSLEWEAFLTLIYARAKDQDKDLKSKQRDRGQNIEQRRLESRLGRH